MNLIEHISEIRTAISDLDSNRAMHLFDQLEENLRGGEIDRSDRSEIQQALDDILALAQSTHDGIGAARKQMEKIISEAGRIDVYDKLGEKISPEVGGELVWKY